MTQHHEILADTADRLAVKIDLAAFDARMILRGQIEPGAIVAFNGPYFGGTPGLPLGHWFARGKLTAPCYASKPMRPRIETPTFAFEAGPELIRHGKSQFVSSGQAVALWRASMIVGEFQEDIIRRTHQVCVGLTKPGKLIVCYLDSAGPVECAASMMEYGCDFAMKCDGGSSAGLRVGDLNSGNAIQFGISLHPRGQG